VLLLVELLWGLPEASLYAKQTKEISRNFTTTFSLGGVRDNKQTLTHAHPHTHTNIKHHKHAKRVYQRFQQTELDLTV
jgi:hypothetical protein